MQFFPLEWYTLLQSVIAASIETLMSDFDYCEVTIVCNTFDNIGSIIGFFFSKSKQFTINSCLSVTLQCQTEPLHYISVAETSSFTLS